jgi:hypothetical protein
MSCAPVREQNDWPGPPAVEVATADPAKLLTSRLGVAILQARISSVLRVENGCLVLGSSEARTVFWPAGTTLSSDGRAVIVPGAPRPIAIGERLLASGGTIPLTSPPTSGQAAAVANGCPGTLVVISQLVFEE